MGIKIRLGDEDRAALGLADEWLDVDTDKYMLSEAEALEAVGINWLAIRNGKPIIDPETGERARHPELGLELREYGPGVQRVWVWLGLRRAGHAVSIMDIDVDLDALAVEFPRPEPAPSPGKDDAAPDSPSSAKRTRRSSATSSPRSRARK